MKKTIILFAAALSLLACKKEDHGDTNLHITGNIKGLGKGTLYIQKAGDSSFVAIDTIILNGTGQFESHLKIEEPEMLYLKLDRGETKSVDDNLPFFAEPGNMTINTRIDEFFSAAKITGSENQKIYEDFVKMNSRFSGQNVELVKRNFEATKAGDVARLDSISEASERLLKRRYLYTANFAKNNAKHEIGPYLALSEIADANVIYLDTIAKSMSPDVAKSKYGKLLTDFIKERKEVKAE